MSRSPNRFPTSGVWGLCALLLAACDSRELVAPGLQPAGRPRTVLSEPVSLGSNVLPPPPNTSGAPGAAVRLGTVPANTWVVFEVSGSVSGSWNPDCSSRPPFWPCAEGPIAQSFMSGADPWAPVTIAYTYEEGGTHVGRALLRGTGESSAIGLYHNSLPSTLDGYVKANTLTSWDPNFGVTLPSYINLSGGFTVTATMIPSPFRVTESADESGMITYTAEPLYGLEFSNPYNYGHLPPGDLVWTFFPGDSADQPDHSWPGWYMYDCERKLVCRFRPPPGPGRMQISAYVERQRAYVRSKPAVAQEQLTLTCTGDKGPNQVTRGEELSCTASAPSGSGPLTVTGWSFDDTPREDEPRTASTWSGRMVKGGVVTVRGHIGTGAELSASATITVVARDWSKKAPDITDQKVRNGSPYTAPPLPEAVIWVHDLGKTRFWPDTDETTLIDQGPNRDYYYFPDIRFRVVGYYSLNDEAFASGSAFQRAQEPDKPGGGSSTMVGGTNYCQQRDVPRQGPRIETHEKEHVRVFRERFAQVVQPEYERIEAMASKNEEELTRVVDALRDRAADEAQAHSHQVVDDPNGRFVTRFVDSSGQQCMLKNVRGADLVNDPNRR